MERWIFLGVNWLSTMSFGVTIAAAAAMMDEIAVFGRTLDNAANLGSSSLGGVSTTWMDSLWLVGDKVWGVRTFQCPSMPFVYFSVGL